MAEVFSNVAETTLASGILAGATSLTVQSGDGAEFPATGDFSVLLQDATVPTTREWVKATARAGDVLTITATSNAWDAGDKVVHVVDKRVMDQLVTDIAAKQALSDFDPSIGASAYATAGTSLANAAYTPVALDAESFDTSAFHNNVTNNTRFTIPAGQDGYYIITAALAHIAATGGTLREAHIFKNGVVAANRLAASSSDPVGGAVLPLSAIAYLTAGDYIELFGYHDHGSAQACGTGVGRTFLSLMKLGT